MEASEIPLGQDDNDSFVWPWTGILVNVPVTCLNGKYVADCGSKLKDELVREGLHVVEVTLLSNDEGHSGDSIVEFTQDWAGFSNALFFDKSYGVKESRKRFYYCGLSCQEEGIFGWVAREDDYNSNGIIGEYLRKHKVLKTVSQVEALEKQKHKQLVLDLRYTNRKKKMRLQEMETRYTETSIWVNSLIAQKAKKDEMHQANIAELQKMQQNERIFLEYISSKHQKLSLHLEARDKELNQYEDELKKRQVHIELEERKVRLLREEENQSATLEQRDDDENKIIREYEKLHRRIIELEKQVGKNEALELVADRMRCTLWGSIIENLKQKEEELENLEALCQVLIVKERMTNDELKETREELINGLAEHGHGNANIGVKKMGELDRAPFFAATRNSSFEGAEMNAAELCTQWVVYLKDPEWHPFKIVCVEGSNDSKIIIEEEDERLSNLKKELGEEVYEAVARALMEMSEYNLSGRNVVLELWNFKEKRKATLHEGISWLLNKLKTVEAKGKCKLYSEIDKF